MINQLQPATQSMLGGETLFTSEKAKMSYLVKIWTGQL
jgi:hypothetical protein